MNASKNVKLVFVCSGTADVGELTDLAARNMKKNGQAAMSCLASIAARDPDITFNAQLADKILVIDGCPKKCASKTFRDAGFNKFLQFDLSEIGLKKGKSTPNTENVQAVVKKGLELLDQAKPD